MAKRQWTITIESDELDQTELERETRELRPMVGDVLDVFREDPRLRCEIEEVEQPEPRIKGVTPGTCPDPDCPCS